MKDYYILFLFLTVLLLHTACEESDLNYNIIRQYDFQSIKNEDTVGVKKKKIPWFFNIPSLPVLFATSPTIPQGKCKRQVEKYLEELNRGTLWAVRMFDASTKYPEGVITGHTRHYGNFDECFQIQVTTDNSLSESSPEVISGKYCLMKIEYQKLNISTHHVGPYLLEFDLNGSMWNAIEEKGDFRRVRRYLLELALCVPNACSASDVETALYDPLKQIGAKYEIHITNGVKDKCQTRTDSVEFSIWSKIYCYIVISLVLLTGVSTYYDMTINDVGNEKNESPAMQIFMCFSAQRTYRSIVNVTYTHPGLDCIHFFRLFLMCCAVFGHRMLQYFTNPMINSNYLEYTYSSPSLILFHNGTFIIECFFAFGGMLLTYYMLLELDKQKKMNFSAVILIRYFRFTPSYIFVISFITLILPHLGSGPYWEYKIGLEANHCAENWWTNLLLINNYVNADKICMFQSWYLCVDYHLYIIALFVIYSFWKMPRKIGYPFLIIVIFIGCSIPFCLSYFYYVQPMFKPLAYMHDLRDNLYFTEHYIKTHERLSSYFVGVLGGAIIYDHSLSPWKIPKPWAHFPFVFGSFLIGSVLQIIGLHFYNPNVNPTLMQNALYASLSRPIFAGSIVATIIFISISDKSEFHHKLFKPRWAQPLAKLTYGVYLIHNIHQTYDIGVARNARTFSIYNVFWDLMPDIIFSFSVSFIFAIIVEGPFRKIQKLLIVILLHEHKSAGERNSILIKKSN